jgi:hypothetical protein
VVYNFRFDHTIPPTQIKRFNTILKIIRKRNTSTQIKEIQDEIVDEFPCLRIDATL